MEKKKKENLPDMKKTPFLVSVLSQALNASFSTLFPETKLSGRDLQVTIVSQCEWRISIQPPPSSYTSKLFSVPEPRLPPQSREANLVKSSRRWISLSPAEQHKTARASIIQGPVLLVYSAAGPLHLHSGWPDSLMGPLMVIHWPDLCG